MACLTDDELTALLEQCLDAAALGRVDEHVASCASCRRLVAELGRPGTTALAFADTEASPGKEAGALAPLADALARTNAERKVGATLKGKWTLDRVLGMGGMAQVFAATHRNGKKVAIKLLRPELGADPSILERFLQEGYVANKVEHRGAVSVLDDGVDDDGAAFLVMELLEGETLGRRLAKAGKLPPHEVVRVTRGILDVLIAAHDKEIVHRDIKPENVFVESSGAVRLLDFGIARVRELSRERGRTQAGAILGTPSFMPPEQARGRWEEVDARSDVWAVGATMYTLLTGAPVRSAETLNEELLQAMTVPVPPLRRALPEAPVALARVVDKALAMERSARFASAQAMREALEDPALRKMPARAPWTLGASALALVSLVLATGLVVRAEHDGGDARPDREVRTKAVEPPAEMALPAPELAAPPTPPTDPTTTNARRPAIAPRPAAAAVLSATTAKVPTTPPAIPNASAEPTPTDTPPAAAPAREVLDRRR